MKHQCKTMKELQKDIDDFNEAVRGYDDVGYLSSWLYDALDDDSLGGIIFDVLIYGKKRKKTIAQGFGMRWLYCPFCGKKIDKK